MARNTQVEMHFHRKIVGQSDTDFALFKIKEKSSYFPYKQIIWTDKSEFSHKIGRNSPFAVHHNSTKRVFAQPFIYTCTFGTKARDPRKAHHPGFRWKCFRIYKMKVKMTWDVTLRHKMQVEMHLYIAFSLLSHIKSTPIYRKTPILFLRVR